MTEASIARLSTTPWAAALLQDPNWSAEETLSRILLPTGENSFFAETLSTNRTIRTCLTLRPTHISSSPFFDNGNEDWPYKQIHILVELGGALDGYPGIIHGGMAATLLDEISGLLLQLNVGVRAKRAQKPLPTRATASFFTAYLNTSYRKPVPTPGVILCTARIERLEGRKVFLRSTIEDGAGSVYTVAESMFLQIRPTL